MCVEDGIEFKKRKQALSHLFVVQTTLLSSFNWTKQTKGTGRLKSVIHTSNENPLDGK